MLQNPRSLLVRKLFGERSILMPTHTIWNRGFGRVIRDPEAVGADRLDVESVPAERHDDLAPSPVVHQLDRPVNVHAVNSR